MTGFDKSPVAISKVKENLKFFDFKKLIKVSEKIFLILKKMTMKNYLLLQIHPMVKD